MIAAGGCRQADRRRRPNRRNHADRDRRLHPGTLTFNLPLAMAGLGFTAQGIALELPFCLRLTDPLALTVQVP